MEKFIHQETGLTFNLTQIPNTDFWSDKDGDLYLATHGTCESVSGQKALEAILMRGKLGNVDCPLCGQKTLKTNPSKFPSAREIWGYGYEKYFEK